MDIVPRLRQQNPRQNKRGYGLEKLSPLLSEMQAGNADRNRKLENNRYSKAGTLIKLCMPPCMGKTIAAVFLCLSAVSVKGFLSWLLLPALLL